MKKFIIALIVVVVAVIVIAGVWLYTGKFNASKAKAFKQLSLPVALVSNKPVSGQEFMQRFELAELLFKDDPTYKIDETQGQILDQLIDDAKLKALAQDHDIVPSAEEIEAQYRALINQFAGGDEAKFIELLQESYHLNVEEFKDKVIRPEVLRANLTIWYHQQQGLNQEAYNKQQELLNKLDQGQPFEEVVKAYTQDEATKDFGGDTGFVKLSELVPEFKNALADKKNGDRVLIASRYGLHIVQVVEIDRTQDEPSYHLQQIFVQGGNFDEWYAKQVESIKAVRLIKF